MKLTPTTRTELTGPWAGFGFQTDHMWTPEGYTLYPEDMRWWSLTCNIAREWRLMMAEARDRETTTVSTRCSNVIYLRDVLQKRRRRAA